MARSLEFYEQIVQLKVGVLVTATQEVVTTPTKDVVFATLKWGDHELMLQTVANMAQDVPTMDAGQTPTAGGTIYFRGIDPDPIAKRAGDAVIKGPLKQWYGMREVYVRDPDGHVLCFGKPDGAPPAG